VRVLPCKAVIALALYVSACTTGYLDTGDDDDNVAGDPGPGATAQVRSELDAVLNLTPLVNPFIGTDDSNSPNPVPGGAGGSTYPGPLLPFGMVQLSPDTPTASPSGYRNRDTTIEEFSLTHFDGAGCPNTEDINILPITGAGGASPGTSWTN
jgi:putative alpha-1,2-mannosidase